MAKVGFALHMAELLNWWNYLIQESSCFCNYSNNFVCRVNSQCVAGSN